MITFFRGYFMSKHDDDVIDHDELYELDNDVVDDLEALIGADEEVDADEPEVVVELAEEPVVEQPVASGNLIRIKFRASLNGYRRGDEVSVSPDDQFFSGLIKQQLVEVL